MSLQRLHVTVVLLDHVHTGAHVDDEKTGYGRDEAAIGADPCGQRSALPIPIGFRIAAKSPKGHPNGQNR